MGGYIKEEKQIPAPNETKACSTNMRESTMMTYRTHFRQYVKPAYHQAHFEIVFQRQYDIKKYTFLFSIAILIYLMPSVIIHGGTTAQQC